MNNQQLAPINIAQAAIILVATGLGFGGSHAWAQAPMSEPFISYTVQPKDSMQGLSSSLLQNVNQWPAVARLNSLKNPNLIYPGQIINIPKSLLNFKSQPRLDMPGKVLSVQGDAKLNGQATTVGSPVPEGARLQTGAGSSLLVQLGDGSRVQLMPQTLADVTTQHGYALRDPSSSASTTWFSGVIRLTQGVLDTFAEKKAQRATPLQVTTPTSLVGVRGTQFRVAFEDPASGTARTEILEGQVVTENTTQKVSANIGGGFGAAIKPQEREIKVVALLPALKPEQLPPLVLRSGPSNLKADWTVPPITGAAGYRAQFATDDQFAMIVGDVKSTAPALDVSTLPNGSYWARVRGVDPSGIEGYDAVKLVQIQAAPLPLMWPSEVSIGAVAVYSTDGVVLRINTQSPDLPQQLTAQVARDIGMTDTVRSLPLSNGRVLLKELNAGDRVYVRFNGTTAQGQNASSAVYELRLPSDWGSTVQTLAQALQPLR
jgi:hypothetical protein